MSSSHEPTVKSEECTCVNTMWKGKVLLTTHGVSRKLVYVLGLLIVHAAFYHGIRKHVRSTDLQQGWKSHPHASASIKCDVWNTWISKHVYISAALFLAISLKYYWCHNSKFLTTCTKQQKLLATSICQSLNSPATKISFNKWSFI